MVESLLEVAEVVIIDDEIILDCADDCDCVDAVVLVNDETLEVDVLRIIFEDNGELKKKQWNERKI